VRGGLMAAVAAAILLVGAAPAAIPEGPINFITVDELKTLLGQGRRVDIIDVRHWDSYVEMHIKGARSMPIRVITERSGEISKTGLVVFY
jgi:rhodanese-related sulfurtransferase